MSIFEALGGREEFKPPRYERRKLSLKDAETIRQRYAEGNVKQVELAAEYGITQPQVSKIVKRKQWKERK